MPKYIFIQSILFFHSIFILGQNRRQPDITFDTDYFDAVDHWVVLPEKATDSTYLLGYVYLDEVMGFTLAFENKVTIDAENHWIIHPNAKTFIIRTTLNNTTPMVYRLPKSQIETFKLPEKPLWLKLYDHEKSPEELVLMGYQYSTVGKSDLAIPLLEKAYASNPETRNLAFELSFAYNATAQYYKAISILNEGIANERKNYMLYRELGYAMLKTNRTQDAEKVYEQGIQVCENEIQRREMAIDMAQTFYRLKDVEKFEKWAAILKQ